jgi:hypothetical protein
MAVEPLKLGEEAGLGEIGIDDPDRIARVHCGDQLVAGRLDRLHVPGRDIAGGPDQGEALHGRRLPLEVGEVEVIRKDTPCREANSRHCPRW